jgi:hypothetical protein
LHKGNPSKTHHSKKEEEDEKGLHKDQSLIRKWGGKLTKTSRIEDQSPMAKVRRKLDLPW